MINIHADTAILKLQNNLEKITKAQSTALNRLSTGLRINQAKDDAASYSIAKQMSTKISSMEKIIENIEMGLDFLSAADGAVQSVTELLTRLKDLATQASNDTYDNQSRQAIQMEINAIQEEISRILTNAEYNGISVFQTPETFEIRTMSDVQNYMLQTQGMFFTPGSLFIAGGHEETQAGITFKSGVMYYTMQSGTLGGTVTPTYGTGSFSTLNDPLTGKLIITANGYIDITVPSGKDVVIEGTANGGSSGNIYCNGNGNVTVNGNNWTVHTDGSSEILIQGNNNKVVGSSGDDNIIIVSGSNNNINGGSGNNTLKDHGTNTVATNVTNAPQEGVCAKVAIGGSEETLIDITNKISIPELNVEVSTASSARAELGNIENILKSFTTQATAIGANINRLESALESANISLETLISSRSTMQDADIAKESTNFLKNQILQQSASQLFANAQIIKRDTVMKLIQGAINAF